MFDTLFETHSRLVLFDTETTGLLYSRDEIIEFAAVVVEQVNGVPQVIQEYDELVALSPGGCVPPKIQELTGISTQDLRERGLSKTRVCRDIAEMIQGNTLLLAYNARKIKGGVLVGAVFVLCLFDLWQVDKRYLNDGMFSEPLPADVNQVAKTQTDEIILQDKDLYYRVMNLAGSPFNENNTS